MGSALQCKFSSDQNNNQQSLRKLKQCSIIILTQHKSSTELEHKAICLCSVISTLNVVRHFAHNDYQRYDSDVQLDK